MKALVVGPEGDLRPFSDEVKVNPCHIRHTVMYYVNSAIA